MPILPRSAKFANAARSMQHAVEAPRVKISSCMDGNSDAGGMCSFAAQYFFFGWIIVEPLIEPFPCRSD